MTYKALVDVNIFQDVITKRKGWEEGRQRTEEGGER
jgi:hypothetical protein